jgi:crotonobetainyl-CoA:carnitine CoA-transferase CaiB-like acyl-CoA transferase
MIADRAVQPLTGVRVADFTQVMPGPCCTWTLGDYGAKVIKIERIGAGDLSRTSIEDPGGRRNPVFCSLNRNKRSIALDLKAPAGLAVVRRLIARSDLLVNNFRAGVMERMGLGNAGIVNGKVLSVDGSK